MARHDIEITEGIGERTSRLGLKKKMQCFGEVDACHMGNRGTELPLVRFKTLTAAEAALQALKSGQVFLDGALLKGEWRGTTHVKRTADPSRDADRRDTEQSLTSRDFAYGYDRHSSHRAPSPPPRQATMPMLSDRQASPSRGGGFAGSNRSRSRSRDRKRKRSRSHKKKRSPSRGRAVRGAGFSGGIPGVAPPQILKGVEFEENAAAAAAVSPNPLFRGVKAA
eukprot:TRINITY_DN32253_c0_g1_i1.p1 TRINITY_DN32253_c0_g1~~TRINITY_DN32253_c0_g1_i1.p1  ORF type:complete len:248 (-),score=26.82 TRINITY_DN32253_c0_g1_i1:330-1001(-)